MTGLEASTYSMVCYIYDTNFYFFRDLPPSQGGRYAGFGNTVEKKNDDFFENTMSSLSSVR